MKYAGSDWIESSFKVEMSPLGKSVADLLGDLFLGIYHLDSCALKRVDWSNDHHIEFSLGWQPLSTFDSNHLTTLVILCHDRLIRCQIEASTHKYLKLVFHKRHNRWGQYWERHPTIETAIESCRNHYEGDRDQC